MIHSYIRICVCMWGWLISGERTDRWDGERRFGFGGIPLYPNESSSSFISPTASSSKCFNWVGRGLGALSTAVDWVNKSMMTTSALPLGSITNSILEHSSNPLADWEAIGHLYRPLSLLVWPAMPNAVRWATCPENAAPTTGSVDCVKS